MLILTRRVEEAFVITNPDGSTTRVVVFRTGPGTCKFGIEADRSIKVVREELIDRRDVA